LIFFFPLPNSLVPAARILPFFSKLFHPPPLSHSRIAGCYKGEGRVCCRGGLRNFIVDMWWRENAAVVNSPLCVAEISGFDAETHAHTRMHVYTRTRTRAYTQAHTHTLAHTLHAHARTHTYTHTHTYVRCSALQHTATHCNTLQHTATHYNTHCNTLQHTYVRCTHTLNANTDTDT